LQLALVQDLMHRLDALEAAGAPVAVLGQQREPSGDNAVTAAMETWRTAREGGGEIGEEEAATLMEQAVDGVLDEALERHQYAREDEEKAKSRGRHHGP
jgi:hypothetical protein